MDDELSQLTKAQELSPGAIITTRKDLSKAFKSLGLKKDAAVMVHAGLKGLGYLVNGPHDVIEAVFDCVGKGGTMLVSANTSQNTDPAEWKAPAVPKAWVNIIRKNMRPFDPRTTLIRGRGLLPLAFMLYPDTLRSPHSVKSIAARGKLAKKITAQHPFDESEGKGSPMHKLYLAKGKVLLVGVDLTQCTVLHLAEFLANGEYLHSPKFKCLVKGSDGKNHFRAMKKYPITSKFFNKLYAPLKAAGFLRESHYHDCPLILLDVLPSVNFVVEQLKKNPRFLLTA